MSNPITLKFNKLPKIVTSWDKLLLDPNNPRLNSGTKDPYPIDGPDGLDLIKGLQDHLQISMCNDSYDIPELSNSMIENGFISVGVPSILVKSLPDEYFLTLEGNRRVTAMRTIMNGDIDSLDKEIINSFKKITVIDCSSLTPEEIEQYLGMIHIGGTKKWDLLASSKYLFSQFIRELCKANGLPVTPNRFDQEYIQNAFPVLLNTAGEKIIKKVAQANSTTTKEVRRKVAIYRIYIQVCKYLESIDAPEPKINIASMIEDSWSNVQLRDLFSINKKALRFSDEGLEKWVDACCDTPLNEDNGGKVITAPASGESNLRHLAKIHKLDNHPEKIEISKVLDERTPASSVLADLQSSLNERNLENTLKQILKLFNSVNVKDLRDDWGTEEKELFEKIKTTFKTIEGGGRDNN